MLQVLAPEPDARRRIQEEGGNYYWSSAAEFALRAAGLVSVRTSSPQAIDPDLGLLVLRNVDVGPAEWDRLRGAAAVFEAPLAPSVQKLLGVSPTRQRCESAVLTRFPRNRRPNVLEYPRPLVASPDGTPVQLRAEDPRWNQEEFTWYDVGWPAVRDSEFRTDDGRMGSLLQAQGNIMVLTAPLLDIAGRWLAYPPLGDRAHRGFASAASPIQILPPLISTLTRFWQRWLHAPAVIADPFPPGCSASFSIRHDYDRPVDAGSWNSLLAFYRQHGLKASGGFLPYLLPAGDIGAFAGEGHEVQLHSHAKDLAGFLEGLARVEAAAGRRIHGFTVHGGPSSPGFVGDRQFRWAEAAELRYGESAGPRAGSVLPVTRVEEDLPYRARLMVTPEHHSLDASTRPDDHHLDKLRHRLPAALAAGEAVVLMNHPDIHRAQLLELLSSLDRSEVWSTTLHGLVRYRELTHLESIVATKAATLQILLKEPLPVEAGFRVVTKEQTVHVVVPKGETAVTADLERAAA